MNTREGNYLRVLDLFMAFWLLYKTLSMLKEPFYNGPLRWPYIYCIHFAFEPSFTGCHSLLPLSITYLVEWIFSRNDEPEASWGLSRTCRLLSIGFEEWGRYIYLKVSPRPPFDISITGALRDTTPSLYLKQARYIPLGFRQVVEYNGINDIKSCY